MVVWRGRLLTAGLALTGIGAVSLFALTGFVQTLTVATGALGVVCLLGAALLTVSARRPPVQSAQPRQSRTLLFSEIWASEVGRNFAVGDLDSELYVERACEDEVFTKLVNGTSGRPLVIVGEAGAGKTSVLWSLHRRFTREEDCVAVVVSAARLSPSAGDGQLLVDDIVRDLASLDRAELRIVLLIDTADLLLHDDLSRDNLLDLVFRLDSQDVSVALATRPSEQALALPQFSSDIQLDRYNPAEIRRAVTALVGRFCSETPLDEALDRLGSASARGLPVAEVCERPLFLRLMFELATPHFPDVERTDVTALYTSYWDERVVQDRRVGVLDLKRPGEDLTSCAAATAIALFAAGTPEAPSGSIRAAAASQMGSAGPLADSNRWSHDLSVLDARGVVHIDGRVRFFHQTLFEFAVAKGLESRGRSGDLEILTERVLANPLDLFVAATLEQYLILTGDDVFRRAELAEVVARLLRSSQPALIDHGLAVLTHHPRLLSERYELLEPIGQAQLHQFIRASAAISRIDLPSLLGIYRALWERRTRDTSVALARALLRLRGRFEDHIHPFLDSIGLIADSMSPADGRPYVDDASIRQLVLHAGYACRGDFVDVVVSVVRRLDNIGTMLTVAFLDKVAESWPEVGSDALASGLLRAVGRRSAPSSHIRERHSALAQVLVAHAAAASTTGESLRETALTHARSAVDQLIIRRGESTPAGSLLDRTAAVEAAHLTASALLVERFDDAEAAREVVRIVRTIPPDVVPTTIAAAFWVPALRAESSLAAEAAETLRGVARGLFEGADTTADGVSLLRIVLQDPGVPPRAFSAILGGLAEDEDEWRNFATLGLFLGPAAVGGLVAARRAVRALAADPASFAYRIRVKFLTMAQDHLHDEEIAAAYVSAAVEGRAFGRLALAARQGHAEQELRRQSDSLRDLVDLGLRGPGGNQNAAAKLWSALIQARIVEADPNETFAAMDQVGEDSSRAALLPILSVIAAQSPRHAQEVAERLEDMRSQLAEAQSGDRQWTAASVSWEWQLTTAALEISADHLDAGAVSWSLMLEQAVQVKRFGDGRLTIDRFRFISRHLGRLAEFDVRAAIARFIEAGDRIRRLPLTSGQHSDLVAVFYVSVREIVRHASPADIAVLVGGLETISSDLGCLVVSSLCRLRWSDSRVAVESALARPVPPAVVAEISRNLRRDPRKTGLLFTEIL